MQQIYSPQNNHKTPLKIKLNWKKIGRFLAYGAGLGLLFVVGVFAYFAKDLPSPEKLNNRVVVESTKIYDRTGTHLLYEIHGEEKRTQIEFSKMPDTIKYATIALEDNEFYSHHGIKLSSIMRAVFKDVLQGGKAQGGSTITQQLIKHSMLTSEKTFTRKIKEVILAIELEQKFSKDEILEMYLNEIPYGSNAYGIEAAAQTFFSKHAEELDLSEAALLASLPQAPTYYSPNGSHPEDLKTRQEFALRRMFELGYITEEQSNQAKEVDVLARISPYRENIQAPHFVMYIKEYLEKKYGFEKVEEGGLKVTTTLDWDKQQVAERVVREGAEKNLKQYDAENAALVAMDPKTGQILAMVGSKDYFDKNIDGQVNVTIRDRQPGSSFKPFVYLTAFQKGYTPETIVWDVDTNFDTGSEKEYNPKNCDGKNSGPLKMKEALARSLNVPAVKTLYLAGVKDSIKTAKKMGITTLNQPERYGLSLVLGGGEVKLLDHVNAFSTFATGGVRHDKVAILKIEDNKGETLESFQKTDGEKVLEEKHVAMIDHILSTNEYRAPVFGENNPLRFDNRPVAAKTGTTNEWRDGWTVGYTPALAVGVWAGNNDNSIMRQGADGVLVAAPIWRAFMDETLKNYASEKFPEYEKEETGKDILDGKLDLREEVRVCKIPGKDKYCLASDACPEKEVEKKKFANAHDTLYYVDKENPRGDTPEKPEKDPQFKAWEKAVKKWLEEEKDYEPEDPPSDKCEAKDFEEYKPSVTISAPSDGKTITDPSFTISGKVKAAYGLKEVVLYINGSKITSNTKTDFSYSYTVPDGKKTSKLTIKLTVSDKEGNSASDSVEVETNIP